MTRYRPRNTFTPEARQWTPGTDPEELAEWCDGLVYTGSQHGHTTPPWQHHTCITPDTARDSKSHADPGDWIFPVGGGAYHILSDEEFREQFEPVGDEEQENTQ